MRTKLVQLRYLLACWLIRVDDKLQMDLDRWCSIHQLNGSRFANMAHLLWFFPEFRNLVIYRNSHRPICRRLFALIYPPLPTLYLATPNIGGGLYIQHGFATMVGAKSIGEYCWLNQQVSIGYKGPGETPVIGDHVTITCGAKVLGDIRIGDHVTVGANAVVIRDVEPGCTVGGVPARVLRRSTDTTQG